MFWAEYSESDGEKERRIVTQSKGFVRFRDKWGHSDSLRSESVLRLLDRDQNGVKPDDAGNENENVCTKFRVARGIKQGPTRKREIFGGLEKLLVP